MTPGSFRLSLAAVALMAAGCVAIPSGRYPHHGSVDVRRFGARGDGQHDDTRAFRRALDKVAPEQGVVLVPSGVYRLTGPLELDGTALVGTRPGGFPADVDPLAVLQIDHTLGPAITAGPGATIRAVMLRYPPRDDLDRPPAILLSGIGINIADVKIANAWDGIIADGTSNVGRVTLRDIFMPNCYHTGLYLTRTFDVANLDNIEVWSPDKRAMEGEAVGFRFGRNDELRAVNLFAFAMGTGYLFDEDEGDEGGATWGEFANCSTDFCARGVRIEAPVQAVFSGGSFLNHQESFIVDHDAASVRVSGADLQSNGASAVLLSRSGRTIFDGCTFRRVCGAFHVPRIIALSAESLIVTSSIFDPNGPGIRFGPAVRRCVVRSNIFEAEEWPAFEGMAAQPGRFEIDGNVIVTKVEASAAGEAAAVEIGSETP